MEITGSINIGAMTLSPGTTPPPPPPSGGLFSWGNNNYGALGIGTTVSQSSPVQVGTGNWRTVSSGGNFSLAISSTGSLWSWGRNDRLQLGNSASTSVVASSPVQIGADTDWSATSAGYKSSMAIKSDGTLWAWGYNTFSNLGLGADTSNRSAPVAVGGTWTAVDLAKTATVGIKSGGTLWSWGYTTNGTLGDGQGSTTVNSPVQVGTGTAWSSVAAGKYHIIALKTDGTLWAWGKNDKGQLGLGTIINRSSPVQIGAGTTWSKIACGDLHSIAVKTDGTIWSWGYNNTGQLGQGTVVSVSSPVQIGAGTTWNLVTGGFQATMATRTDGTLWSWGFNAAGLTSGQGQLGLGTVINQSSPVQVGARTTWTLPQMSSTPTGSSLSLHSHAIAL